MACSGRLLASLSPLLHHARSLRIDEEDQPLGTEKRLLFFAEAVTLAHLARPLSLSSALAADGWSLTLACDSRYRSLACDFPGRWIPLPSISPEAFLRSLARGTPLYDVETLERYVTDDLKAMADEGPDLVAGDFRLSLSVSARLANVPYVSLLNAYWSPYYDPGRWPVPGLPFARFLPVALAESLFRLARPLAFSVHSRPLNAVRRRHGLESLGSDLRRVYSDADRVAYMDAEELFPLSAPPPTHRFIGPVVWDAPAPLPPWWTALPTDKPMVFVSLGSSGPAALLPSVVRALAASDVTIVVATAGRKPAGEFPSHVWVADFIPGTEAARRASLVICNGGSLACYQALAAGVPVLGIAGNLDQLLNMQAIERSGAGALVRADRATVRRLRHAVSMVLGSRRYAQAAATQQPLVSRYGAPGRFASLANEMLHSRGH